MNKKEIEQRIKEHDDIELDKLSTIELKNIIETYKELGYKFTILNQTPDDLKNTLETLIHCETLTYKELQRELRYYRTKGIITPLKKTREYLKVALFQIECRFHIT
jgi:uncharacterized membrane protein YgaE (UPF0421/DUF939 family)